MYLRGWQAAVAAYIAEDGVRRTGFGMVRRLSAPFPEETSEIQIGGM